MSKKSPKDEKESQQRDLQSFFYIGSFAEFFILSIIVILIGAYLFVFFSDGITFTKILKNVKDNAPDKDKVVAKLKAYKVRAGQYPSSLDSLGVESTYGNTRLEYTSSGVAFELCYNYFPYLTNTSSCYYSDAGEWEKY